MNLLCAKKFYEMFHIAVCVYRGTEFVMQFPDREAFQSAFEQEKEVLCRLQETLKKQRILIFLENEIVFYGAVYLDGETIILGPMCHKKADEPLCMKYGHLHRVGQKAHLTLFSVEYLNRALSLLYYMLTGEDIGPEQITIANVVEDVINWNQELNMEIYQMEGADAGFNHHESEAEKRILEIVENGDLDTMEKIVMGTGDPRSEGLGMLGNRNVKNTEYLAVAMITLLTRAAVRGGMYQEEAYGLGDVYLQRLEQCKDSMEMISLTMRAQYEFTRNVKKAKGKNGRVYYIEQCKDYIARNLRKPLKVGDIAPALGIDRTYLARKFSETEGITIQQYIMKERCVHAANLLKYSDYPISIISEYFCFSSQSHFGRQFRAVYGMTPKEYRNKYKTLDGFS